MTGFADLGLAPPLLKALDREGYTTPTPIQAQAIPPLLEGRDLIGLAQTGTGKTAAFALPILQKLASAHLPVAPRQCRALILAPTRELASQIDASFGAYGRHLRLRHQVVFGGVSLNNQIRALAQGVDILVATPGRLLDLVDRGALNLGGVAIAVLDEGDHMLDLGFIHAIRRIVKLLPRPRQTLLFSATMPAAIEEIARDLLSDPVRVAVTPVARTADRIEQSVIPVEAGAKPALLAALVEERSIHRGIVFTRTKHGADKVVKALDKAGIAAAAIHGNKSQSQRERALAAFKAGSIVLLVATDIAARGIDVDALGHVINYDLPDVPETYVHRIGRTARAGASGIAIAFCAPDERDNLRGIEKLTRLPIPVVAHPLGLAADALAPSAPRGPARPQPRRGGGHGGGERHQGGVRSPAGKRQQGAERRGQPEREAMPERPPRSIASGAGNTTAPAARTAARPAPRDHAGAFRGLPGSATQRRGAR